MHSLTVALGSRPQPPSPAETHRKAAAEGAGQGGLRPQSFPGGRAAGVPRQPCPRLPAPGLGSGVSSPEAGRALRAEGGGAAAIGGGASPHWPGRGRVEARPLLRRGPLSPRRPEPHPAAPRPGPAGPRAASSRVPGSGLSALVCCVTLAGSCLLCKRKATVEGDQAGDINARNSVQDLWRPGEAGSGVGLARGLRPHDRPQPARAADFKRTGNPDF